MTKSQKKARMQNFEQYLLSGMVANLHNIRYYRRQSDEVVLRQIGLAVDVLNDLRTMLKESDDE